MMDWNTLFWNSDAECVMVSRAGGSKTRQTSLDMTNLDKGSDKNWTEKPKDFLNTKQTSQTTGNRWHSIRAGWELIGKGESQGAGQG